MTFLKEFFKLTKKFFLILITISICGWIMVYPEVSSESIKQGIKCCVNILIPSLFPFMFMATFIVQSQILSNPGKLISKLTKFLFYLPECTAPVIVLGLLGGYPVGARGVKTLFDKNKINTEQLNRMMYFCVNAGPGFLVSLVGSLLLRNKFLGIAILISQIISAVLIGIFCGIYSRGKNFPLYSINESNTYLETNIADSLVESTSVVCSSMAEMCVLVIAFTFLNSIINNSGIFDFVFNNIKFLENFKSEIIATSNALFEVTSGCIKSLNSKFGFMIIAFAVGHGGMCTHMQIASILKNCNFNFRKFCLFRFLNATISLLSAYAVTQHVYISSPVFSNVSQPLKASNSSTVHGSLALVLLSLYFIITVNHKYNIIKKNNFTKSFKK